MASDLLRSVHILEALRDMFEYKDEKGKDQVCTYVDMCLPTPYIGYNLIKSMTSVRASMFARELRRSSSSLTRLRSSRRSEKR